MRLIGAVDLIDALPEHGFEELATRRKQGIAEHLFPWEQAGGLGLLQATSGQKKERDPIHQQIRRAPYRCIGVLTPESA